MRRTIAVSTVLAFLALAGGATADEKPGPALRIYRANAGEADPFTLAEGESGPGGFALVRTRRTVDLKSGHTLVDLRDLPRYLNPSDVTFRPLADAEHVQLLAQRFDYDPLTLDRLVERNLGANVTVYYGQSTTAGFVTGKLLSGTGGVTVETPNGVVTITEYNRIDFPSAPGGASATPTLHWDIAAKSGGAQEIELTYSTSGFAWRADYTAALTGDGPCGLRLAGWAEIANRSGATIRNASVQLMAGEVNRLDRNGASADGGSGAMTFKARALAAPSAPVERSVGDFREYTLDGAIDLPNASISRYALFPGDTSACERSYVFEASRLHVNPGMAPIMEKSYGLDQAQPIASTLTFRAPRALPAGRLAVIGGEPTGAPLLLGETMLRDLPQNEPVTFALGNAFDLRGERTQTDFKVDRDKRLLEETFQIKLRNRGAQAKSVVVREHLYRWNQWEIANASGKYDKRNADTIDFKTDVPPNGETVVTYMVRYHWSESLN